MERCLWRVHRRCCVFMPARGNDDFCVISLSAPPVMDFTACLANRFSVSSLSCTYSWALWVQLFQNIPPVQSQVLNNQSKDKMRTRYLCHVSLASYIIFEMFVFFLHTIHISVWYIYFQRAWCCPPSLQQLGFLTKKCDKYPPKQNEQHNWCNARD